MFVAAATVMEAVIRQCLMTLLRASSGFAGQTLPTRAELQLVPGEGNLFHGDAQFCVPNKIPKQRNWPAMDFAALNDALSPVIVAEPSYRSRSLRSSAALCTDRD